MDLVPLLTKTHGTRLDLSIVSSEFSLASRPIPASQAAPGGHKYSPRCSGYDLEYTKTTLIGTLFQQHDAHVDVLLKTDEGVP